MCRSCRLYVDREDADADLSGEATVPEHGRRHVFRYLCPENKVLVYSVGELNEPLDPGTQFPYTGTIAENIEKENLDYLIVDDTHSSIKAIDWVLFVPKGLYSYVAKALYVRGAMRTVLILCSRKKVLSVKIRSVRSKLSPKCSISA